MKKTNFSRSKYKPLSCDIIRKNASIPTMDTKWISYCAIGELVGFSAAAGFNLLHLQLIGEPTTFLRVTLVMMLATLGGIAEGSILAWFQWHGLKDYLPQLNKSAWIRYTAIIAAIGWFLGMLVPTYLTLAGIMPTDQGEPAPEPPLLLLAVAGMGMGIGLGLIFGYFQSIPLRSVINNPNIWIRVNVLGWSAAMVVLMIGPSIIPTGTDLPIIIIIASFSGLLAGILIGIITGTALPKLDKINSKS